MENEKIITIIYCPDRKGVIANITSWFFEKNINIIHSQQCTIQEEGTMFFMRIEAEADDKNLDKKVFEKDLRSFSKKACFSYNLHYTSQKERIAIMVSKTSHCLYEILSYYDEGTLPGADIRMVIGNHNDLKSVADKFDIPFYYLPIAENGKKEQEAKVISLLKKEKIDLIVLSRYMQILSSDFIDEYRNKIINIHHGFLPAFQGANPYLQAYNRGVKIIGATAHYASEDLDQGPIIEQDVIRVNHKASPAGLREMGKDVEKRTLVSALKAHLEHRIVVFKNKTIVFPKKS